MDHLTVALAKRDFEFGLITGFEIRRSMGFINVLLRHRNFNHLVDLVDARSRRPRMFKSVDTALSVLSDIGFSPDVSLKPLI